MIFTLKKLYAGQSLLRIRMNQGFEGRPLTGAVVDVGGGHKPDYFEYFDISGVTGVTPVDGSMSGIDFERDALPFPDASVDTVLCANVLEHVYNYRFLIQEMRRILKPGGTLIGFVPFLIQYHPDPHDYFRYTKEALARMFGEAEFASLEIRSIGGGPFTSNFNALVLSVPCFLRPPLYLPYALLDALFLRLRPGIRERYPLGFIFKMRAP
ncbi:MAG: methyltransferase domain-containing protein [bacterium]